MMTSRWKAGVEVLGVLFHIIILYGLSWYMVTQHEMAEHATSTQVVLQVIARMLMAIFGTIGYATFSILRLITTTAKKSDP